MTSSECKIETAWVKPSKPNWKVALAVVTAPIWFIPALCWWAVQDTLQAFFPQD